MISRKHKKVCTTVNYIEHLLILASTITGCTSIFAFTSLIGIPVAITDTAIELKICAIAAGIKKCKSIIKKKKKKHNKKVMFPKSKLSSIEVLIFNAWINLNTSHDEFVLYKDMKEEIKNLKI